MNVNDSGWLARALVRRGFVEVPCGEAQIHILNTCSVRDKPEQKVYSALGRIRKLTKERSDAFAVVAGCVAQQIGSGFFSRFAQVRLVVGGDGLAMAPEAIEKLCADGQLRLNLTEFAADYPERDFEIDGGQALSGTAAIAPVSYVNIMQGCNNFCTYCIVPYTRGRQKSRPVAAILEECQSLLNHGAQELILLGQNVNAYGQDTHGDGTSFPQLLHQVAALAGLRKLRFVTPHPKDFAKDTIAAFKELPVLAAQLHLPVQSGSDAVLERMGRKYTRTGYLNLVEALYKARPDLAISTDIIVGFPGETESDFSDTLSVMRAVPYASSFSFCYSDRPGAAACGFSDTVPADVARLRLEHLQAVQQELTQAHLVQRIGREIEVMLENPSPRQADDGNERWQGRDPWGAIVHVMLTGSSAASAHAGTTVRARIVMAHKHSLLAEEVTND